jgi:hypothetical protein
MSGRSYGPLYLAAFLAAAPAYVNAEDAGAREGDFMGAEWMKGRGKIVAQSNPKDPKDWNGDGFPDRHTLFLRQSNVVHLPTGMISFLKTWTLYREYGNKKKEEDWNGSKREIIEVEFMHGLGRLRGVQPSRRKGQRLPNDAI